ncbi:SusD/RagB family nutrient-binding outer membrane lipoprotein [Allomuricauda sp. M10]|uniref:SusD/RagB family nutrient-binding outer membrane lipoprotein n=1 Tax=Allomuricauda sp. M10 TaxID=2683292 RepID=UPI001D196C38|nr:SusD/RagB family nutrient-binding outer membrane lipoprotein [Muricauda sp. M10]
MKDNKKIIATMLMVVFLFIGCEKDFDEINTNSVDPTSESVDPTFLLNNAIIGLSFSNGQVIYDMGIVQQIVTPNSGILTGANYNQDNRSATELQWTDYYESVIKHTGDLIAQLADKPERSNLLHMATIVQSYAFMVLTDTYGDVPYSEAGKGLSDQIVLPKYDSQEFIYTDMIAQLKTAVEGFSESAEDEDGEVMYSGDLDQWRKLGYSLLLRIGMRLVKVDPQLAQETAIYAFNGGVLESNDDNFVVRHDNNFNSPIGGYLNGSEANNFYLTGFFVDYLSSNSDPRLASIAVRYIGAASGAEQTVDNASTDPTDQIGMPVGYDNVSINPVVADLGLESFYAFSQVDRRRMVTISSPQFLLTYSQTQLLLAEAAERGWITGNPQDYFEAGIRANMEQMAAYGTDTAIDATDIDTYVAANTLDGTSNLELINTQYWVSSFLNGPEAYANFRRSGFPTLPPNTYPGQDITGDFINRLTYPNAEIAVNGANLNEAVSRMGPDNLDTHVWWDEQ